MIKFSEELKRLIREADKWFPGMGYGYNYDEWKTSDEWIEWITKKLTEEKRRRGIEK